MFKTLLILALSTLSNCVLSQNISFYKENITMKIEADSFCVTGIYYLRGDEHERATMIYPFPVDSLYGEVDSFYIYNLITNESIIPQQINKNNAVFSIDFADNQELIIQISYRQKLLYNYAEYILKSTINWKESLDEAYYQLIIPEYIEITKFSIFPGDSIIADNEKIYMWEEYNYLPEKNLIFEYRYKQ